MSEAKPRDEAFEEMLRQGMVGTMRLQLHNFYEAVGLTFGERAEEETLSKFRGMVDEAIADFRERLYREKQ